MANLHCECQELKPKVETNSSFLVLHPPLGVDIVNTVGSHLKTSRSRSAILVAKTMRRLNQISGTYSFELTKISIYPTNNCNRVVGLNYKKQFLS